MPVAGRLFVATLLNQCGCSDWRDCCCHHEIRLRQLNFRNSYPVAQQPVSHCLGDLFHQSAEPGNDGIIHPQGRSNDR